MSRRWALIGLTAVAVLNIVQIVLDATGDRISLRNTALDVVVLVLALAGLLYRWHDRNQNDST